MLRGPLYLALAFLALADCRIGYEAVDGGEDAFSKPGIRRVALKFDNRSGQAVPSVKLLDFPVMIRVTSAELDGDEIGAQACLHFEDPSSGNDLAYEVEQWNPAGETALWLRVPTISAASADEFVYMYYGDEDDCVERRPPAVWDSGFLTVMHFSELPGSTGDPGVDSISGRAASNDEPLREPTATAGRVGAALSYDGIDDRLTFDMAPKLDGATAMTVEAWVKPSSLTMAACQEYPRIASMWAGTSGYGLFFNETAEDIVINVGDGVAGDGKSTLYGFALGEWHYVVGTWAASPAGFASMYLDGVGETRPAEVSIIAGHPSTSGLKIGGRNRDSGGLCPQVSHHFAGAIDELRISNVERGAHWVAMQHRAITNEFVNFGSPE